jgi:hypothetical protein
MSQSSQTAEKIEKQMEIQKKISMVKEVLGQ